MKSALPIVALVILIGVAYFFYKSNPALQGADQTDNSQQTPPPAAATPADPSLSKVPNTITIKGKSVVLKTLPSGVKYYDVNVGSGVEAQTGRTASVLYSGSLLNGTVFDASVRHGNVPFSVPLGQGRVIKGWDEGIPGMKVGGERILVIPAPLAYGANSPTPAIPANSTLQFDVTLKSIR
jgi:FKBP-type peptidyl-prolyl cis-trans isomerase